MVGDYRFEGERGPMRFADLFGDKQTLGIYNYTFETHLKRPCPCARSCSAVGKLRR